MYEKVLALVLQLPPSLTFEEAKPRLEELFSYLPSDFRYPIEGRHESWFTEEYMTEQNHCLVWNEVKGVDNPAKITSDYVYLRLIGDRSIPESEFGKVVIDRSEILQKWTDKIKNLNGNESEFGKVVIDRSEILQKWTDKIKNLNGKVKLASIMANNHFEGFGPATANTLRMQLGLEHVAWEEKKQQKLEF
jgi:uncharacterized protein YecE (DUF72 family)